MNMQANTNKDDGETRGKLRAKPYNEELHSRFCAYLAEATKEGGVSEGTIARRIEISTTRLSKYKNGKPEGDVGNLEQRIADLLKAEESQRLTATDIIQTSVIRQMHNQFRSTRRLGAVGVTIAAPGIGKTMAIASWKIDNPTTPVITASPAEADQWAFINLLFDQVDQRGYSPKVSKWRFLVERFKGLPRLIIIDDAHYLTRQGRAVAFSFHDATRSPIEFVGEPRILDALKDQAFQRSRVQGRCEPVLGDSREVVKNIVEAHFPNPSETLLDLAEVVANEPGHLRNLTKQLLKTKEVIELAKKDAKPSPAKAFEIAHARLVRDFEL